MAEETQIVNIIAKFWDQGVVNGANKVSAAISKMTDATERNRRANERLSNEQRSNIDRNNELISTLDKAAARHRSNANLVNQDRDAHLASAAALEREAESVRQHTTAIRNSTTVTGRLRNTLTGLTRAHVNNNREVNRSRKIYDLFKKELKDNNSVAFQLEKRLSRLGRAMLGLVIGAVIIFAQSFSSALTGLAGAAIAVATNIGVAAGAIGGVFVASVAQAIPLVGLFAAVMQRLSIIQQAVHQNSLIQRQASRHDVTALDQQRSAANQLVDAQIALVDAQRNLTEARREARRELQDLILAEEKSRLSARDSAVALQAAAQRGDIGAFQQAQLEARGSRLDLARSRQDLRIARTGAPGAPSDRVRQATQQLAAANRQLADSHIAVAQAASKQSAAEGSLAFFMSQLSPAERALVKQINQLQNQAKKLLTPVTDVIIRSFSYGIRQAERAIFQNKIIDGFKRLANGVAKAFRDMIDILTSRRSMQFWGQMLAEARRNLGPLEKIAKNLFVIFRNIATAAAPVLHKMLKLIANETGRWAKSSKDIKGLTDFFFTGLRYLRAWWGLLKAVINLWAALTGASAKSGAKLIRDFTDTINEAADSLRHDPHARTFFDNAIETVSSLGKIIVSIGGAFLKTFNPKTVESLANVIDAVLIPAIVNTVNIMGQVAIWLDRIFSNKTLARIVEIAATFILVKGAVGILITTLMPVLTFFVTLSDIVLGLGAAMGFLAEGTTTASLAMGGLEGSAAALGVSLGPLVLIIVGIIAVIILFRKQIIEAFGDSGIGKSLSDLSKSFEEFFTNINNLFGPNGKFSFVFKGLQLIVKDGLTFALIPLKAFIDTLSGFMDILNGIMEGDFGKVWRGVKKIVLAPLKEVLAALKVMSDPFRKVGETIANALKAPIGAVIGVVKGMLDKLLGLVSTVLSKIGDLLSQLPSLPSLPGVGKIDLGEPGGAISAAADQIDKFRGKLTGANKEQNAFTRLLGDSIKVQSTQADLYKKQADYLSNFADQLDRGRKKSKSFMDQTVETSQKLRDQRSGIGKTIRGFGNLFGTLFGVGKQSKGLGDVIAGVTNKVLKAFGVKRLDFSGVPGLSGLLAALNIDTSGGGQQTGGFMGNPKQRGPDDRLIAVAGGEAVLTGHHQQAVNMALAFAKGGGVIPFGNLHELFRKDKRKHMTAPGFQKGGMVDPRWDPGSEVLSRRINAAVGSWARRYHVNMTAGYDPGGGHISPGHNITGTATDMVPGPGGSWNMLEKGLRVLVAAGFEVLYGSNGVGIPWPNHGRGNHAHIEWIGNGTSPNALQRLARAGLGAPKTRIPRIVIMGPDGPLKTILQAQADQLRGAANIRIRQASGARAKRSLEGLEAGGKNWRAAVNQISSQRGWNAGDWLRLIMGESSGDPTARNTSSGAFGLGQFLGSTADQYAKWGAKSTDPVRQIIAMAHYIHDRYGNPTNAYRTWLSRSPHWYGSGGIVPGYGNGGIVPGPLGSPQLSVVHGGEAILPLHKFQTGGLVGSAANITTQLIQTNLQALAKTGKMVGGASLKKFQKVLDALNQLTADNGTFALLAEQLDKLTTILTTRTNQMVYQLRNGIVSQVVSNENKARLALQDLATIGNDLANEISDVAKLTAELRRRIKRTKDKAKKQQLKIALQGLVDKGAELADQYSQNLQDQLDAQNQVWQEVMNAFEQRLSDLDLVGRILELQGQISGAPDISAMRANLQARAGILQEERSAIQAQLASAQAAGNIELVKELNTALLENQLALLENTQAIKELDGTVGQVIGFNTTAWQVWRRAILNGMGGLLPQFMPIPSLQSGGIVTKAGLVNLHAGEVVRDSRKLGPVAQNYYFTQPMQVADPTAIGAQIAWQWKKNKT